MPAPPTSLLPNFLLIGAQRSGTTALYHALRQHPDVFFAPHKEPHYWGWSGEVYRGPGGISFPTEARLSDEAYLRLFDGVAGQRAIGEASTDTLVSPLAPARLHAAIPGVRMIAVLRNPVERAYSAYLLVRYRLGIEPERSFAGALALERQRLADGWLPTYGYRAYGDYAAQLDRFYAAFPREQLQVWLHEDWRTAPERTLASLFGFLGVDPGFLPTLQTKLDSQVARHEGLDHVVARVAPLFDAASTPGLMGRLKRRLYTLNQRHNRAPAPPMDPQTRAALTAEFREPILRLQDLLGRDLSAWLAPPP